MNTSTMDDANSANLSESLGTATYSPEDNKLRLFPNERLEASVYQRVSDAGFSWAPKQQLFVAPKWTPERFDLLVELCGEVGDEDTSLVERAVERAERFDEYSEKREREATRASDAVAAITDGIPAGQPIIIGHHSEKHARKDAERIENGLRKAVRLWETAEYWQRRAASALRHAKFKERPDVRARRIKAIEAEKRKHERTLDESQRFLKHWLADGLTMARAMAIANYDHISRCFPLADFPRTPPASQYEGSMGIWSALNDAIITEHQARDIAVPVHEQTIATCTRWLEHIANRIAYERAMLDEQGGLVGEAIEIQPGGKVLVGGQWATIIRLNKSAGVIVSVTTNARYGRVRGIEEVQGYEPPSEASAAAVAAVTKQPTLCNYPGEGFIKMTTAEWKKKPKDYAVVRRVDATAEAGAHRARFQFGLNGSFTFFPVYLTDMKRTDPPSLVIAEPAPALAAPVSVALPFVREEKQPTTADALREQLKSGVQAVVAPQLFPTPFPIVVRMIELAEIQRDMHVLEPSAGTGRILAGIRDVAEGSTIRTAIEINGRLCAELRRQDPGAYVFHQDFLEYTQTHQFDRALLNPPFANAQDIAHITHALSLVKKGGRVVAICANGPRQNAILRPIVEEHGGTWDVLPSDTFAESGTTVSSVLLAFTV